MAERDLTIK